MTTTRRAPRARLSAADADAVVPASFDRPPIADADGHASADAAQADRRRFLQQSAATGLLATGLPAFAQSAGSLEGYAFTPSVRAGQTLQFAVRDLAAGASPSLATWRVVRLAGWVDLTMKTGAATLRNHAVPADAASAGCRWPAALSLPIPADWPSGVYCVYFATSASSWCSVPFVVRPPVGAVAQRVLVVVPVSTAQAKNNYGGKSLYERNSSAGQRTARVAFARPLERWQYGFDPWQPLLARWLHRRGVRADFCTDIDLHVEPGLLNGATLMVVAGHHAYWTREARTSFEARIATGLNAAFFSGQNMCWQSRLETHAGGSRVLVCHKNAATDPGTRDTYKTVRWAKLGTPEYENASIGMGSAGTLTWTGGQSRPSTPFRVETQHWVFEGTLVGPGSEFGGNLVGPFTDKSASPITGEVDSGASGSLRVKLFSTTKYGAPAGATLLATAGLGSWRSNSELITPRDGFRYESCEMTIFSRNAGAGTVFNAGTSDWVKCLALDLLDQPTNTAAIVTANVIRRLASTNHLESADVRVWFMQRDAAGNTHYSYVMDDRVFDGILLGLGPNPGTADFRAFAGAVPGSVPIYRHLAAEPLTPGGFRCLLSRRTSHGNGWTLDGIAFYAFPAARSNARAVYRYPTVRSDGMWQFRYSALGSVGGGSDEISFYAPEI